MGSDRDGRRVKIRDIAKIVTGKTPPTVISEYYDGFYPFITPSDIPTYHERHLNNTERTLSDKGHDYQKQLKIPAHTSCFVAIGSTVGKMCLSSKESFTNQQLHALLPRKGKADKLFLFYYIRTIYPWIKSIADAKGSGVPIINKTEFENISVNIPPMPIQKKIAAVLSSYDDLIENNNRRIAILEKMAEEIYREWFVRMRFPGHEKVKLHKGVPEGWETKTIGNVCVKVTDGSHFSPDFFSQGKLMASVKDMTSHGFSLGNMKTISEQDFKKLKNSDCQPLPNDILIAKDGSYLKHVMVWNFDMEIVVLSSIAILRPNTERITPYFFSLTLNQDSTKAMMGGFVSGSTLPRIILKDFKKMKLLVPSLVILKEFEVVAAALYQSINLLVSKNANLTNSRNLLLSRLITGKLSVEDLDIHFSPNMESPEPAEGREADA